MSGIDLSSIGELLPRCTKTFANEEACIEYSGRGSAFIHTSTPICIAEISLPGINALPRWLLSIVYLTLICYLFLGVALASDRFCDGIYEITNIKRKVRRRNQRGEWVEVEEPVWNWVVANITLMALGTSAPEIVLATVEALLTLGQPAGMLGPACIVGSAAYNFLMITACCTLVVPDGTFKRVTELRVYITTAAWSIFAYIWMLVVYTWWTPNKVTLTEALLTLLFFVLLVFSAWSIDVRLWKQRRVIVPDIPHNPEIGGQAEDAETAAASTGAGRLAGSGKVSMGAQRQGSHALQLTMPARSRTLSGRSSQHAYAGSRTGSRVRTISGRTTSGAEAFSLTAAALRRTAAASTVRDRESRLRALREPHLSRVHFRSSAYSCLEEAGAVRVTVVRSGGDLAQPLQVHYETQDGDAIAGVDYKAIRGTLMFQPHEQSKVLDIKVPGQEPGVSFWVAISPLPPPSTGSRSLSYIIVQERVRITIIDDDVAGALSFESATVEAAFRPWQPWAEVVVVRRGGQDGQVQVTYETEDGTAVANREYVPASGLITFEPGEKTQVITVKLITSNIQSETLQAPTSRKDLRSQAADVFPGFTDPGVDATPTAWVSNGGLLNLRLRLSNPIGGATLGRRPVTTITLGGGAIMEAVSRPEGLTTSAAPSNDPDGDDARGLGSRSGKSGLAAHEAGGGREGSFPVAAPTTGGSDEALALAFDLWPAYREQFFAAFNVPQPDPDEDEEEDGQPGLSQYIVHLFSIFFKVVFAVLIPPAGWRGGYPCFVASLGMIVALVYVLEQAATLLGCVTGLSELMVGISLVAAGTSVPDTFASMVAARRDPNADAAVGNITGSNCVNVFLGLGLPWTISAIYYAMKGKPYDTPVGDLGFAVGLFAIMFTIAITLQFIRRYQGGELGGSRRAKLLMAGIFSSMWVLYLLLSGFRSTGKLEL